MKSCLQTGNTVVIVTNRTTRHERRIMQTNALDMPLEPDPH